MVFFDPIIEVAIIAAALFAFNYIIRNKFMDQNAQEEFKVKQKEWKTLLKEPEKNERKIESMQKEIMDIQFKVMKGTMPVMMITLALFIFVVLPTMNANYNGLEFPPAPYVVLPGEGWFWYYFILAIVFSIALGAGKRIMKKMKNDRQEGK